MQAVIHTGGKQYIVTKGDTLFVEKLEGDTGRDIVFDQVLLINDEVVRIGTPTVAGAKVTAKIVSQDKASKVLIYKYKRRKGYHKKQGHRQQVTKVQITEIHA